MWPFEKLQCLLEGERGSLQDTLGKPSFCWGDSCPMKDTSHPNSLHRWTSSRALPEVKPSGDAEPCLQLPALLSHSPPELGTMEWAVLF